jgi:succinate dehydrogenase / fumarate reductase cytochrome b subunit
MFGLHGFLSRNPDLVPRYLRPGMWGWALHRVTGLLILVYLLLHLLVIGQAAVSPQSFDAIMKALGSPFWRVLEVGLLACVLYHGINGVLIILFDLGYGIRAHRVWWYAGLVLVIVLFIIGAVQMLMPVFG